MCSAELSQTAVYVYDTSEQILYFGFAEHSWLFALLISIYIIDVNLRPNKDQSFQQVTSNSFRKNPKEQAEKCMPGEHAW